MNRPSDSIRATTIDLIGALHRLRDLGNTLLVVEHDRDVIASSDYLCDFGPRAGRHGGRIVAQGPANTNRTGRSIGHRRLHQRQEVDSDSRGTSTGARSIGKADG